MKLILICIMVAVAVFIGCRDKDSTPIGPVNVPDSVLSGSIGGYLPAIEYHVEGDLTIAFMSTVTVAPGASFIFEGPYSLVIDGVLQARGTETDSIQFVSSATNDNGWGGIEFRRETSTQSRLQYCRVDGVRGAPALKTDQASPRFDHCVFAHNRWSGPGGGTWVSGGAPEFYDCEWANNTVDDSTGSGTGGGMECDSADAVVIRGVFSNNKATHMGSGANIRGGGSIFTDCVFGANERAAVPAESHWGGGVACVGDMSLFYMCTFASNDDFGAGGGAYAASYSYAQFVRCVFRDNSAGAGGGLYAEGAMCGVIQCTFVDNASEDGSAVHCVQSGGSLNSCIIGYSFGPAVVFAEADSTAIHHCDLFAITGDVFGYVNDAHPVRPGTIDYTNANGDLCDVFANIYLDPRLMSVQERNFNIFVDSPCIDAVDTLLSPDPDGSIADIGAFPYEI